MKTSLVFSSLFCALSMGLSYSAPTSSEPTAKKSVSVTKQGQDTPTVLGNFMHDSSEATAARMRWWNQARFGIFIHFGTYSVLGGSYKDKTMKGGAEWILHELHVPIKEYRSLANQLTLSKFNANDWAKAMAEAGAKYVVVTTKHHDGFCMFDTKYTDYNIVKATPYKKDFMMELANASRKQGLKFCTYYSIMEWDNPLWGPTSDKTKAQYLPYMRSQLKELVDKYNTELMWFDGEYMPFWGIEDGNATYNYLRRLKPDIIINNRVTKERHMKDLKLKASLFKADYATPEQNIPENDIPKTYWESCMTMNGSWGYHSKDNNWKSTETLVRQLINTCSKGGNYLLNIGPKPDGTFPEETLTRLSEMGQWMKVNGEGIYGTNVSPLGAFNWGRTTRKVSSSKTQKTCDYLFIESWPKDNTIIIPALSTNLVAQDLASGKKLPLSIKDNQATISLDPALKRPYATTIKLTGAVKQ